MPLFLSTVAKPWRPEAQQSTACEQQEDSMKVWSWIQKTHWWAILCLSSCTWVLKIIPRYGYFRMGKLSIAKVWQPLFKIPRISRTALNSFKRGRICIPGYVHWSSVSSLWINHFCQTMAYWDVLRIDLTFLKYSSSAVVLAHKCTCLV